MDRIIEIPAPIGDYFCHRHINGTVEHHETRWDGLIAECRQCDLKAVVSLLPLERFLINEDLLDQLCEPKVL